MTSSGTQHGVLHGSAPMASGSDLRSFRHDLRTPINHIIGYSELLLEECSETACDGTLVAQLERIHAAGKELLDRINNCVEQTTIESPEFLLSLCPLADGVLRASQQLPTRGPTDKADDLQRIQAAAAQLHAFITGHGRVTDSAHTSLVAESTTKSRDQPRELDETESALRAYGRLLVVDDNDMNRDLLTRRLERLGYTVTQAVHGRQALDILRAAPIDLLLLDILMPELDGYQVLERLKADVTLRHIPVIVLSALDELDSVVRCIEMGAEDYLPKPFNPVLLQARIGAALDKKRLRDIEIEYLAQVARVTAAAAAVEAGTFEPESLRGIAGRTDALGSLARVFQRMAREIQARETRLKQQVQDLRIEIDLNRKAREVAEITETDYFQQLRRRAHQMRQRTHMTELPE